MMEEDEGEPGFSHAAWAQNSDARCLRACKGLDHFTDNCVPPKEYFWGLRERLTR